MSELSAVGTRVGRHAATVDLIEESINVAIR
jgi:hypothetical protein